MKRPSIYVKMKVLGAIDIAEGRTRHERIHNVAKMTFTDEHRTPHQFTWRTIQTWYYRYKNHGITGMENQSRVDKGTTRKVTPEEVLEAINAALPHFREKTPQQNGHLSFLHRERPAQCQPNCPQHVLADGQQVRATQSRASENKTRLAFCMQYANQLWQADTMFGPHVSDGNQKRQAKLIAFIDDASRVLCHGEFFFEENVDSMVRAIRSAFYKRGLPEQLLVDNGSIYCCQEITLICARAGCLLRHTAVRDAAAKGKIERFFRRVRDQFLIRKLDLASLESLNRQFSDWVEQDYNATVHSVLGMKPIDGLESIFRGFGFSRPVKIPTSCSTPKPPVTSKKTTPSASVASAMRLRSTSADARSRCVTSVTGTVP